MHPIGTEALGPGARTVIDRYLSLPIGAKPSCPYFNNRRRNSRGGLRALKGKGSPEEIAEEAEIRALQTRVAIKDLSTDKLKEFLVDQDLGVDCSGFAYHVLGAALFEKNGKYLGRTLRFKRSGFAASLITRLRPAENAGVSAFRLDENSVEIPVADVRPGDFITFIGTGKDKSYNHIVVITGVDRATGDKEDASDMRLSYAHSYAWPTDGVYGHGVREGDILVKGGDLLGGTWKERGAVGNENFTYTSACDAQELTLRRLRSMI
ncbi:MAG: hypothetical protein Q8L64_05995 [bacterium]|nr:hypothetical protein [bacterium]